MEGVTTMTNLIYLNRKPLRRAAPTGAMAVPFQDPAPKKRSGAQEPLKNPDDIVRVSQWFIDHGQYRNNFIFILGVNTGFRAGDILALKIGHVIDDEGYFRNKIEIIQEKNKKRRTCYLNDAVLDAADLYFSSLANNGQALDPNEYLFKSEGNRPSKDHFSVDSYAAILKDVVNNKLGLDVAASTHMMRKTFAYHVIMSASDRSRALEFLQKVLGHSNPATTLLYAGITNDEMLNTYVQLNLGHHKKIDVANVYDTVALYA